MKSPANTSLKAIPAGQQPRRSIRNHQQILLLSLVACVCLALPSRAATTADDFVPETGKGRNFGKTAVSAYTPAIRKNMETLYRDKIGMFVHYGPYAQLEGYWKGQRGAAEWIMNRSQIPVREYEAEAAKKLNPEKFNAEEWVNKAKGGGLRFIVVTTKHHDGFALFKSAHPYNIYDFRPFGRDLMAELAQACRKGGVNLGFYYSQSQDWHEDGGVGNTWDFPPLTDERFNAYFNGKVIPQVKELAANYGDLFMFWFDTPTGLKDENCRQLMDVLARLQPGALINSRLGGGYGHFDSSLDHGMPPAVIKKDWLPDLKIPWQTHASIPSSWGHTRGCDSSPSVTNYAMWIHEIAFVVSRGGVFLLNVAPAPDGTIPPGQTACLKTIGDWLKVNGESIYGTDPSPFLFPPYPITSKPNRLYLHLKDFRGGRVELAGLLSEVESARVLSDAKQTALKLSKKDGKLAIQVPQELVYPHSTVVVLNLRDRQARVADETLVPQPDGTLHLPFSKCEFGQTLRIGYRPETGASFRWGEGPGQILVWTVRVNEPRGEYQILAEQDCDEKLVIELRLADQKVRLNAREGSKDLAVRDSGQRIKLDKPGTYKITVRPAVNAANSKSYRLKSFTLEPVKRAAAKDDKASPPDTSTASVATADATTAAAATPTERSILSMGDDSRLAQVFAKARRGETITVGAIGGSITQGASVSSNYLTRLTHWWRATFPKAQVKSVNAGIGGTGSNYGSLRARRDLLSHQPDFVVIEYAVNDRNTKEAAETFEGVVRQVMKQTNQPAVVLLFMVTKTGESAQEWLAKVGAHYGLPMVSYRDAVWPELEAERMKWPDLSPDKVHPNDHGHALAAGWISRLMEQVLNSAPTNSRPTIAALPPPLFTDLYEFTTLQEAKELKPLVNDGWELVSGAKGGWTATTPGSRIEFEMPGRVLFASYRLANGPMGKVRVTVDGKDAGVLDGWFAPKTHSPRRTVKIGTGLAPRPHRIGFELLSDRNEGSAGNTFQILGLGAALGKPE